MNNLLNKEDIIKKTKEVGFDGKINTQCRHNLDSGKKYDFMLIIEGIPVKGNKKLIDGLKKIGWVNKKRYSVNGGFVVDMEIKCSEW